MALLLGPKINSKQQISRNFTACSAGNKVTMKFHIITTCVYALITLIHTSNLPLISADDKDLQLLLWNETQELLQRREYALAVNILENGLDDADLFSYTKRIQEDLDAVKLLKKFSDTVDYSAEKLPASKPLTVLSKKHLFKSLTSGNSGKIIVLTDPRGDDVTYPINRLDSATWLEMAEPELRNWPERDFVTGLFYAFDRYPNARLARTKLNAAAENGQNVAVWIKRLEDAEQQRKLKQRPKSDDTDAKDLILGKWSVKFKNGPDVVWDIGRGGSATIYAYGRAFRAKWIQESSGVFRMTGERGNTFVINVSGDRVFGKKNDSTPFQGVRQAK